MRMTSGVWMEAMTRWPVSAAFRQVSTVRWSRSSPTMMHVGVLAHGRAQGRGERFGVGADLALRDDRQVLLEQVLDRVLDGDDVGAPLLVDVVDDGRQGGRLAVAGGAGDQDQAALQGGDLFQHLGQVQLLEGPRLEGDQAQHGGVAAVLAEDVHPEAGHVGQGERAVVVLDLFLELFAVVVLGQRLPDQPPCPLRSAAGA